jgi:hypothetical protein
VDAKQQEADKQSRKRKKDIKDGLQMRQEIADMSKNYDWGGAPFDDCKKQRNDMVSVMSWALMAVQHELVRVAAGKPGACVRGAWGSLPGQLTTGNTVVLGSAQQQTVSDR